MDCGRIVLFSFLFACGLAVPCAAEVIELRSVADNTLYEESGDALSNGFGPTMFVGRTGQATGSRRRALVRFEPLAVIPAGAVIDSVVLRLSMSRTRAGATIVSVHRVQEAWGEGASDAGINGGAGAPAEAGDASWLWRIFPGAPWSISGGAFVATPSASRIVDPADVYVWGSTSLLVADVQSWIDDPAQNFGWLLLGDESQVRTAKRFDTREAFDPATRPALLVSYRPPVVGVDPLPVPGRSWGRIKAMYRSARDAR